MLALRSGLVDNLESQRGLQPVKIYSSPAREMQRRRAPGLSASADRYAAAPSGVSSTIRDIEPDEFRASEGAGKVGSQHPPTLPKSDLPIPPINRAFRTQNPSCNDQHCLCPSTIPGLDINCHFSRLDDLDRLILERV